MFSFGIKNKNVKTGQATPVSETKASITIQTALKLEAKALGTLGNAVTVNAVANSSDNLAVSVTGNALTILLANATGSKNTMTLIAALIASTPDANAIFNAIVITGATQMTAFTVQSLTGGVNGDVGYLGEVRYDTNNTEWKMCYTTGGCYYWCIADKDVYPALGVEYISHYCTRLSKLVYKMAKEMTTAPAGGVVSAAHGITGFSRLYESPNAMVINGAGNNHLNYYASVSDFFAGWVGATNCQTSTPNSAALNSRPVYFKFKYIKV